MPFAASQEVNKILEITPFMLGTVAGGAADCKFWERYLGMKVGNANSDVKEECSGS